MRVRGHIALWLLSGLIPLQISQAIEQKIGTKVSFREAILLSFSPVKKNKDFKKNTSSEIALNLPDPRVLPGRIARDPKNKRRFTLFLY